MANELIKEIVQLEQELAARLAAEQERARAWLEGVRTELDQTASLERQALQQQGATLQAAALAAAQTTAAQRLSQAEALAQGFAALDDEPLRVLILARLVAILPARNHDHPDVED